MELDPPGPPIDVSVEDLTKTSCTLTWEPPEFDGGSPITGYYIEKFTGSRWIKVNKKPVKKCAYSMDDLIELSEYEFRVSAENEAGIGKPSESTGRIIAKDPFDVPGKPDAPEVEEIKPDNASLAWSPPKSDGGAEITNYIIEMRRSGESKWKVVDKKVKDTKLVAPNLQEGAEYEFRVTAENKAGAGPPSAPSKPAKYSRLKN